MDPSARDVFRTVFQAYQTPDGSDKERAIKSAISTPETRSVVEAWLKSHPKDAHKSPIMNDLSQRIINPLDIQRSRGNPVYNFVRGAIGYVSGAVNHMAGSPQAAEIENWIIAGDTQKLHRYFENNPETLFKFAELIQLHSSLGTIPAEALIPLLRAVASNLKEDEPYYDGSGAIEKHPSIFHLFSNEIKEWVGKAESQQSESVLNVLIKQDLASGHSYLSDRMNIRQLCKDLMQVNLKGSLPLLAQLPGDMLLNLIKVGSLRGGLIRHHDKPLATLLPLIVGKMSPDHLMTLTTSSNLYQDYGGMPLSDAMYGSLSKMECLRLFSYRHVNSIDENKVDAAHEYLSAYIRGTKNEDDIGVVLQFIRGMEGLTDVEKDAAIAYQIEARQIKLSEVINLFDVNEFLRLAPHLQYADFRDFKNVGLANKFIKSCSNLVHLKLNDGKILDGVRRLPNCQNLNCRGSINLKSLPELPNCISLKCSDCYLLKRLPVLNLCEALDCGNCYSLKMLPELPNCIKLNCDSCRLLHNLPDLPRCKTLICPRCNFTELPNHPYKLMLNCTSCSKLVRLPERLNCYSLYCDHCLFDELPSNMSGCRKLSCKNCRSLRKLPDLLKCYKLNCDGCHELRHIPDLPKGRALSYSDCFNVVEIPRVPKNCIVVDDRLTRPLDVDIAMFSDDPKSLLYQLGVHLLQNNPFPLVRYFEGELMSEAEDMGGVARDFINRLIEKLFKDEPQQGFLLKGSNFIPTSDAHYPHDQAVYMTLGMIFAFCLSDDPELLNLKTGPVFHENLYHYLLAPGKAGNYAKEPSENWLLNNYIALIHGSSFDKLRTLMEPELAVPELTEKEFDVIRFFEIADAERINGDFFQDPVNRALVRQVFLEEARSNAQVKAILWITQGMQRVLTDKEWKLLKAEGANALQEHVQGVINVQALKDKLDFEKKENVDEESYQRTVGYLNTWIETNDTPERLSSFVRAVSGNNTLCAPQLKIEIYKRGPDSLPAARTCFFLLEVSADYPTQEAFNDMIELIITEGLAGLGFSFK